MKGWLTIPNVRCAGQNEIDLLAIDPVSLARYHIEVSISISQSFRKLTAKPYDPKRATNDNGEWHGPFASGEDALERAHRTPQEDIRRCGVCSPNS